MKFSLNETQHKNTPSRVNLCSVSECHDLFIVRLIVIMLIVIMLCAVMLNVMAQLFLSMAPRLYNTEEEA